MMPNTAVIDNFLPACLFEQLKDVFAPVSFNWFWNDNTGTDSNNVPLDDNFYFSHVLYGIKEGENSPLFKVFEPVVYFIDKHIPVSKIIKMKTKLYTNQNKRILYAKHIDVGKTATTKDKMFDNAAPNMTITILNFTSCDGGTIVRDEEYVSKENQALMFSNEMPHCGITQTNSKRRICLNVVTENK